MRRIVTSLDGLDRDHREAAELAARRSGLSLEEWITSALSQQTATTAAAPRRSRRTGEAPEAAVAKLSKPPRQNSGKDGQAILPAAVGSARQARDHAARTAVALDSVASWIEQAEDRLNGATRAAADQQERLTTVLSDALGAIKDRLESVERQTMQQRGSRGPASEPGVFPAAPLVDALSALQHDVAKLGHRLDAPKDDVWAPVVGRIRTDIERLHDTIANLATRDEVAGIEQLLHDLAGTLGKPRPAQDLTVLVGSVASLQRQVHQLSDAVTDGIPQRVTAEVDALKRQLEIVAAGGVDPTIIGELNAGLAALRQSLAHTVEPQRIERLSEEVATLGRHMAEIRINQIGRSDFAGLKGTLEEIRGHLQKARDARDSDEVPAQLRSLGRSIETLVQRPEPESVAPLARQIAAMTEHLAVLASKPEHAGFEPVTEQLASISGRLSTLTETMPSAGLAPIAERLTVLTDRLSALASQPESSARLVALLEQVSGRFDAIGGELDPPQKELLARLDRLEDSVRQVGEEASTAPIELMLRSMGEKLESAPQSASLDGLEAQMAALMVRLEQTAAAPISEALSETLTQVKSFKEDAAAIAERAAKAALKEARQGSQPAAILDTEALRQGISELKSLQAQADRKTQHTLKAVHNALETLVLRSPLHGPITYRPGEPTPPSAAPAPDAFPAVRLEAAVRKLHKAAIAQTEEITTTSPTASLMASGDLDEILLEPGTPRPATPAPTASFTASVGGDPVHVRSSFIAAARRATQTVPPEVPANPVDEEHDDELEWRDGLEPSQSHRTFMERIRQTFDTHRRPLLLSIALLILMAGTFEIVSMSGGPADEAAPAIVSTEAAPSPESSPPEAEQAKAGEAPATAPMPVPAPAPATTGSLFQPSAIEAKPIPSDAFTAVAKRIPDMAAVGDLPIGLPATLRQAALAGEPSAAYEVATRSIDGRGIPRDLALAARLLERAAQAGLVPAQARLGNLYEKGLGVPRDLTVARTWYERAGTGGNARAMHNLAVLFAEGVDGKPDFVSAQRWFLEAAETGLRDSQFNLGVLLARGLGATLSLPESYKWFALAAAQGDDEAAKKRDEIATRLSAHDLGVAKALTDRWRARPLDPAANDAPVPSQGSSAARTANGRS
jgi:localization factor PodJL